MQPKPRECATRTTTDRLRASVNADDDRVALSAATAQGCRAKSAAAATKLVQERQREPVAAHADRMPERDRAAVDVDDVERDAELAG